MSQSTMEERTYEKIDRRTILKGLGAGTVSLGGASGVASAHHPGDVQVDCPGTVEAGEEFTVDVTWEAGHSEGAKACFRAWMSTDDTNWKKVGETKKSGLATGETLTFEMTGKADVTACQAGKTYTLLVNGSEALGRCPNPGETDFPIESDNCDIEVLWSPDRPVNKHPLKTDDEGNRFRNCQDVVNYIGNNLVGETNSHPSRSRGQMETTGDNPVTATQPITFTTNPEITIEVPEWPNMTDEEVEARDEFICQVEIHEQGHVSIANTVAEAFSKTLSAEGSDEGKARSNLAEKMRDHVTKFYEELDRIQREYDKLTEHGAFQSQGGDRSYTVYGLDDEELATGTFPGGDDAVLNCP